MTPIHEQVAHLQRQIEALTEQVAVLANRPNGELPNEKQNAVETKEIGINRFRKLHGKA